jgi:signal transduction histidine kinase
MKVSAKAKFTVLFKFDPKREKLGLGESCEAPDFYGAAQNSGFVDLALGEGPSGITAAERAPKQFSQLKKNENFAPWVHLAIENKFNCIWSFPLLNADRLVGVFQFYFEANEMPWSAEQQQQMLMLCNTAAPLLEVAWTLPDSANLQTLEDELQIKAAAHDELSARLRDAQLLIEEQSLALSEHQDELDKLNTQLDKAAANGEQNGSQTAMLSTQLQTLTTQVAEHLQQIAQQQSIIQHKEEQLALQRESLVSYAAQVEELQEQLHSSSHSRPSATDLNAPADTLNSPPEDEGSYRYIAGGMAEEFSNLLTGVLGHSSLAAAEMGDAHPAIGDLRSIERAARNAARLAKRLMALSGESRRATNPIEVGDFLKKYTQHLVTDQIESAPVCVTLPPQPCPVHADAASLEVVLDGMLEHAYAAMLPDTTCEWKLSSNERQCIISLHYFGPPRPPKGWGDEQIPAPRRHRHYELFVSREAAKALGGEIEIEDLEGEAALRLFLPLCNTMA